MTTTLIVRDASLAINGAPEKRGEAREHLRLRIAEVAHMDARTAEECAEVLSSVAGGEGADPDVLEGLLILALAQPPLAERLGLPTVATGRQLAVRLERMGDIQRTLAALEILQQHFPGQESLERDLAQLMRRQGMVQDLVNRYFERAQKLMHAGRNNEAAGWLREVLQLDPSRKDAARMIRDLRFKRVSQAHKRGGGFRFVLVTLALSAGLSYSVLREFRLRAEFLALQPAAEGNVNALRRRLADLEDFIARNPLWHGALGVLSERSELRVQLAVLDQKLLLEQQTRDEAQRERLQSADLCRARGLQLVQSGDLERALESFRQALEYGGPDWPQHERVSRDVSDLEALSSEKR